MTKLTKLTNLQNLHNCSFSVGQATTRKQGVPAEMAVRASAAGVAGVAGVAVAFRFGQVLPPPSFSMTTRTVSGTGTEARTVMAIGMPLECHWTDMGIGTYRNVECQGQETAPEYGAQ